MKFLKIIYTSTQRRDFFGEVHYNRRGKKHLKIESYSFAITVFLEMVSLLEKDQKTYILKYLGRLSGT